MTLHTFQGQSAGPVEEGQPKNAVDKVIIEPGTRGFEGNNPGTLYMGVSRATTIGTGGTDSALYFTGPNMTKFRVTDIKHKKASVDGSRQMYKKIALREKWVQKLEQNTTRPDIPESDIKDMKQWCNNTVIDQFTLDDAISKKYWRWNMYKSVKY